MYSKFSKALMMVALVCAAAWPAHADLKYTAKFSPDKVQLKKVLLQASPEQRAAFQQNPLFLPQGLQATYFVSGHKSRVDYLDLDGMGRMSILRDLDTQQSVYLFHRMRRYVVRPYHANNDKDLPAPGIHFQQTDTTKTILGHVTRKYIVTMDHQGGGYTSEIWAAGDLPPIITGLFPQPPTLQNLFEDVQGLPLEIKTIIVAGPSVKLTVFYQVLSLSSATLPASTFAIPMGYKTLPKKK